MQQDIDPAPALPLERQRELVHKLNNQLTVILATAEASVGCDDPAETRRSFEVIAASALSMAELVRAYAKWTAAVAREGAEQR